MKTVKLDDWEFDELRRLIAARALNWMQHKALGNLRGSEIKTADRWIALTEKF